MLKLGKMTDYCVVLLVQLARSSEQLVSGSELATEVGLSPETVAKCLKLLNKADLVMATRGVNGGYALSDTPKNISVRAIVEAVEGAAAGTN